MMDRLQKLWCEWTHGGGHIQRDQQRRINWRCGKCGRWGDYPVPLKDERQAARAALGETK